MTANEPVYRLGIVRRSRYLGIALLRGTTLVCLASERQTGRRSRRGESHVTRLCRDYSVEEVVNESEPPSFAIRFCPRPVVLVSLDAAKAALLPGHAQPTRYALTAHVLNRFPSIRRRRRLSRDRTVALYAVALVLTRATTTQ